MKLVIAEKLSAGQSIAKVLGAAEQERGYIEGKEKYYTVGIKSDNISAVSERIDSERTAQDLQAACQNRQAVCVSVRKSQKTAGVPKLYDLTMLQREANRIFGFTAKQTLDYRIDIRLDNVYFCKSLLGFTIISV